ncbi:MAG: glycerol-3-phosphate responsive antiterminator [Ruminococcaceae bacterium]|nr:glycerol-3-phosphate responsive antiterminator [Oscillospiraceae bacterium]
MQISEMNDWLEQAPIIATVHSEDWEAAINAPVKTIFCLKANLRTIRNHVKEAHLADKKVFVHIDLSEGIGKDKVGIEFLAGCGVDGIITTKGNMIKIARDAGMITVQRFFALDSQGVVAICEITQAVSPDYIEIMPGVIDKIISKFAKGNIPVIAGGLIETKQEITNAIRSGAVAVSTGKAELWSM